MRLQAPLLARMRAAITKAAVQAQGLAQEPAREQEQERAPAPVVQSTAASARRR